MAVQTLLAFCVLGCSVGCDKQEKPKVRTEPWLATSASRSSSAPTGKTIRYLVDQSSIQIELRAKEGRSTGSIDRVEGFLNFDPVRPEETRGSLRADLFSLKLLRPNQSEEDPESTLRALWALELGPTRPSEERERERFAELRLAGLQKVSASEASIDRSSKVLLKAFLELTLHRFRVPLMADLELQPVAGPTGTPWMLRVRTQRPLVVSLLGHEIVPRAADGRVVSAPEAREAPREARISAEVLFRPESIRRPSAPIP